MTRRRAQNIRFGRWQDGTISHRDRPRRAAATIPRISPRPDRADPGLRHGWLGQDHAYPDPYHDSPTMAATPGVLQKFQGLHTLHALPRCTLGAPTWVQRTAARFTTRSALNLCCRRERAELPLTGMFSS